MGNLELLFPSRCSSYSELPDRASIAVLPFKNLSGDPNQEYFSDGITEDLITQLYKMPDMVVIAPQSSSRYKGKPVKVQQVGEELGVRYVHILNPFGDFPR